MPRSSDAKSRFIKTAGTLFRKRGYHAVGLTEIIEAAQAPKGSFYHHFPGGKEELAEQAMVLASDYILNTIHLAFSNQPDFNAGARQLISTIAGWVENVAYEDACPVMAIGRGGGAETDRLRRAAAREFERWLSAAAQYAQAKGDDAGTARRRALGLLCAIEGAWDISRIARSREAFDTCLLTYNADNPK
jgi:TetR/AcrR family transcriptional repressor of lmrAB and yxaGH operons